jgi:hypothetical protein
VLTELSDMELTLVAGGQGTPTPPPPAPTGNLGIDVVRFFTDAAHGASSATLISDLKAIQSDIVTNDRRVVAFLV